METSLLSSIENFSLPHSTHPPTHSLVTRTPVHASRSSALKGNGDTHHISMLFKPTFEESPSSTRYFPLTRPTFSFTRVFFFLFPSACFERSQLFPEVFCFQKRKHTGGSVPPLVALPPVFSAFRTATTLLNRSPHGIY